MRINDRARQVIMVAANMIWWYTGLGREMLPKSA